MIQNLRSINLTRVLLRVKEIVFVTFFKPVWILTFLYVLLGHAELRGQDADNDGISDADEGASFTFDTSGGYEFGPQRLDYPHCGGQIGTFPTEARVSAGTGQFSCTSVSNSNNATVTGLEVGKQYKIYTDVRTSTNGTTRSNMSVSVSGGLRANNSLSYSGGHGGEGLSWRTLEFVVTATATTASVRLSVGISSQSNAQNVFAIVRMLRANDSASVDSDSDGIPDYLDIDSDNDGTLDLIETNADTDNDRVPNRLDLDSDNDGCSDAIEGGATSDTTPDFVFTGATGDNGLVNHLENGSETGTINYASTYANLATDDTKSDCSDDNDLGIVFQISDGIVNGPETQTFLVRVRELLGEDTDDAIDIVVRLDRSNDISFDYNAGLTSIPMSGVTVEVDNSNWVYDDSNPLFHIFRNTGIISANSTSAFGFQARFDPGFSDGKIPITARIAFGSGGESVPNNNIDTETIVFFGN